MARVSALPLLTCSAVLTLSAAASAHVRLVYPTPRYATPAATNSSNQIKDSPCGVTNDSRTQDMSRVTELTAGSTITVEFAETVQHPGFFRISFDDDGQDAFVPPPLARTAIQMGATTLPVLKDNIPDTNSASYTAEVVVPNMPCENCTLQLIQVMTNAQTWAEEDIYFTCADIRIVAGNAGAGGMGAGGMGAGGMSGGGMSSGGMAGGGASAGGMSAGGMAGAAGNLGTGGAGAGGMASGGAGSGAGGAPTGGAGMSSGATGGMAAGAPGTGGSSMAGAPATGGVGTGGVGTGGTGTPAPGPTAEEGGCTCSTAPRATSPAWLLLGAGALSAVLGRRRRRPA
jgi:MYXO-CTERM domain-containing protein